MRTYRHSIAGETVSVHVPETDDDLDAFRHWMLDADRRGPIALDTETAGLDIYRPGFRLRTVQFGDEHSAWVIHWERGGHFRDAALYALRNARELLIHNAPFDWLVLDQHAGIPLESMAPRTTDTRLLVGLVDPRHPHEGGIGSALKPAAAHYVDPSAPDTQDDLTSVFRSLGYTKAVGWSRIPLDHPTYNLYAGLDVILTARLEPAVRAELKRLEVRPKLITYEHELARICAVMQRTGLLLDEEYTRGLSARLAEDEAHYAEIARQYGVENINAPAQIAEALLRLGETLTERTATGNLKVDKAVLSKLADVSLQGERLGKREPNPLAEAILRAKRASKWRTAYADTFLETMDADGRVHPAINSMQARTGRMSITRPALQTLPSSEWMIRRAILADPGHVMVSIDFQAVELRVLAALAKVKRMKEAIRRGEDLHSFTARLVFGSDFTPQHRKIAKGIAFGKVYGGGLDTIQRQTGAPRGEVEKALKAYDRIYPEIRRKSRTWQREALETGQVYISVTGRRLPLDEHRMYAVVNYACQSAARDCLGQALINMNSAGLLPYLRLPIHDEVLASAPRAEAEDVANAIAECMTFDLYGVPIEAESEIGGRSWGSLYGADT